MRGMTSPFQTYYAGTALSGNAAGRLLVFFCSEGRLGRQAGGIRRFGILQVAGKTTVSHSGSGIQDVARDYFRHLALSSLVAKEAFRMRAQSRRRDI